MRVLLVAEQLRRPVEGGIGTYVRGLASGLAAEGAHVTLWASRPPRGGPDPLCRLGTVVTSPLPARALVRAWDRGACGPPRGLAVDAVHA
ncbi:MAG: glycosyltransferase family 1 protein, partial [Actinobacteria bacterium]|nr:glycosyltransferase family 1 protein [Actinomycetota bacterium]